MLSGPVQVPSDAVSVLVRCAVPVIVGGERLAGGSGEMISVGLLVWVAIPSTFDAVTSTRITSPTSASVERVRRAAGAGDR